MAQYVFRDMVGLKRGLEDVAIKALDDTMEQCYNKLMDVIDEDVYKNAKHECNEHFYERTKDIKNAFIIKKAKKGKLGISATASIDFDESKITHNTVLKQHANSQRELDGTTFFGILNNDVNQGIHGFAHVDRRPFFNDWLELLNKKDKDSVETIYEKMYKENLGKQRMIQSRKAQSAKG